MNPSAQIETIILSHSSRGLDSLKDALPAGYCERAARLLLANKGVVLIGTGFPVAGTFETDGPVGGISLYHVLAHLGFAPIFVCPPPLARVLQNDFTAIEFPILSWEASLPIAQTILTDSNPALLVSIEQPGVAHDGRYYNMRKQDITAAVAKCDGLFQQCRCPTIAFGDGGNEIGMGNLGGQLAHLPIIPSVTPCTELVLATVSNWGVYGVLAALSQILQQDLLTLFRPEAILSYLVAHGTVDGVTGRAELSEDGFPLAVGLGIIAQLQQVLSRPQ